MRRSPVLGTSALALSMIVLMGGVAQAVVEVEPVITGTANQFFPWANDDYVIYTQSSRAHPDRYTIYAEPRAGGAKIQVNAVGTKGADTGGFDPGTNTVIYEQWMRGRPADLFFYDLDTGQRTKVSGVNSRAWWEWNPLISSSLIAFQRDVYRNGRWETTLRIRERMVGGQTRAIRTWWRPTWVFASSIGDRYLSYSLCTRRNCFAYLYDWDTDTEQRIPSLNNQPQYTPVVDEADSTVYFSRAGDDTCGPDVSVWRLPIDLQGEPTQILSLPRGIDTGWLSSLSVNEETDQMDLYFQRWDCAAESGDIYVARGVDNA